MKFLRKYSTLYLLTAALMLTPVSPAQAAQSVVPVHTPEFPVYLNGISRNNNEIHPPLIYRGITYIPMTQDEADLMNLSVHWNSDTQALHIIAYPSSRPPVIDLYRSLPHAKPAKTKHDKATVAGYPIYVNGTKLDQSTEPYPLLNYRNITYFPLTWRFVVDEFGWKYEFDPVTGLKVYSSNFDAGRLPHPNLLGDNSAPLNQNLSPLPLLKETKAVKFPADAFKEPFYYKNNKIFSFVQGKNEVQFRRRDLNGKDETIGSAAIAPANQTGSHHAVLKGNNELLFLSHFGGATMGSNTYYLLPENGNAAKFSDLRYRFLLGWKDQFVAAQFSAAGPLPGLYRIDKTGNHTLIGEKESYYSSGVIEGDFLYVQKEDTFGETGKGTPLYRVDLNTGKHTKILDQVFSFRIDEDDIYYRKDSTDIYRFRYASGQSDKIVSLFEKDQEYLIFGGKLFATVHIPSDENVLINLYQEHNGQLQLVSKNISQPVYGDSNLVYRQHSSKDQTIVITDQTGIAKAKIEVGQKQVDYFINGKEMILWSWQDQTVRHYRLP